MAILDVFRPVAALEALIEKEKTALLSADFETLEKLLPQKESLLALVAKANVSADVLTSLKSAIERNNALLAASAKGIQHARHGMSQLNKRNQQFSTYGPAGASTSLGHKPLTIKRKI